MIIDGFDELLSKSHDDVQSDLSDSDEKTAQTMLSTIAQLLEEKSCAKIVLTSRKSSIFAGKLFEDGPTNIFHIVKLHEFKSFRQLYLIG